MSLCDMALTRFCDFLKEKKLISGGDKILLAISGGLDSTALLYLFFRLKGMINLSLLAVHVNHQLRGEDSDMDEQHCRELCMKFNVPLLIRKIDVEKGADMENRLRERRFATIRQVMQHYSFRKIATAHHKDDQVETVLMNLLRGCGLKGLGGIKPASADVIHPLLCFSKAELKAILTEAELTWREDVSNDDESLSRNFLRHKIIPMLKKHYNRDLADTVCRQAEIAISSEAFIQGGLDKTRKKALLEQSADTCILSLPLLQKLSEIELFHLLQRVYFEVSKQERDFYHSSFQEIRKLMSEGGSKHCILRHKVIVVRQYEELIFSTNRGFIENVASEEMPFDTDRSWILYRDYRFHLQHLKTLPKDMESVDGKSVIIIDLARVVLPLKLRSREAGDRFIPSGMGHQKKLKDFFIDEKVPKYERDKVPLLIDGEKILWIVGMRMDSRACEVEGGNRFLMITAEHLGSSRKRSVNRK